MLAVDIKHLESWNCCLILHNIVFFQKCVSNGMGEGSFLSTDQLQIRSRYVPKFPICHLTS